MKDFQVFIAKIPFKIKYIFSLFLVTRIIFLIIGISSRLILEPLFLNINGLEYGIFTKEYGIYSDRLWLDIWGVWDTGWYLDIAANGYSLTA
jgi:hypothetical protein